MANEGAVASPVLERLTLAKVSHYMLTYILLNFSFWQLDRINIGFAQLTMGKDLHLSAGVFGLAAGIYSLSALFLQIPAAICFEKFGARRFSTNTVLYQ